MNMGDDDARRLDEIRKYAAIYGRFDCKRKPEKPLTLHEVSARGSVKVPADCMCSLARLPACPPASLACTLASASPPPQADVDASPRSASLPFCHASYPGNRFFLHASLYRFR